MIKITNTPPPQRADNKKKAGASSASGTRFKDYLGGSGEADAKEGAEEAHGVNNFLFMQEVSDEDVSRQKAVQQGKKTLQALEQLHRDLLLGRVPEATLRNLEATIDRQREQFTDPRLTELLDEIELRASVELAKLERDRS